MINEVNANTSVNGTFGEYKKFSGKTPDCARFAEYYGTSRAIDLSGKGLESIEPLESLPVQRLCLNDNFLIYGVRSLSRLNFLRDLELRNSNIHSLVGLGMPNLRVLGVSENKFNHLRLPSLEGGAKLERLSLENIPTGSVKKFINYLSFQNRPPNQS